MIAPPVCRFVVGVVALAASGLALPAAAETTMPAASASAALAADVPSPRVRPASFTRKRVVSSQLRVRRTVFRPAQPRVFRPYERVAVHWPILFIGVGF